MALKGVEETAALALKALLDQFDQPSSWNPGGDPPDLEFAVEGRGTWAVEVTELHEYLDYGGGETPRPAVDKPLIALCREVQARVCDLKNRDFLVSVKGPLSPEERAIAKDRLEEHIRSGRIDAVDLDPAGNVRVYPIERRVRVNYMVGPRPGAKVPGTEAIAADLTANIEYAVKRILEAKVPQLRQLSGFERRILLIWSENIFAEPEEVRAILEKQGLSADDLDSVLLVYDGQVHWVADPGHLFSL